MSAARAIAILAPSERLAEKPRDGVSVAGWADGSARGSGAAGRCAPSFVVVV
jgi:hypothetical protein